MGKNFLEDFNNYSVITECCLNSQVPRGGLPILLLAVGLRASDQTAVRTAKLEGFLLRRAGTLHFFLVEKMRSIKASEILFHRSQTITRSQSIRAADFFRLKVQFIRLTHSSKEPERAASSRIGFLFRQLPFPAMSSSCPKSTTFGIR